MLESQDGVCAICFKGPSGKSLAVDHNHITGEIRGLLCDKCNRGIGYLQSDLGSDLLRSAVRYTERFK